MQNLNLYVDKQESNHCSFSNFLNSKHAYPTAWWRLLCMNAASLACCQNQGLLPKHLFGSALLFSSKEPEPHVTMQWRWGSLLSILGQSFCAPSIVWLSMWHLSPLGSERGERNDRETRAYQFISFLPIYLLQGLGSQGSWNLLMLSQWHLNVVLLLHPMNTSLLRNC